MNLLKALKSPAIHFLQLFSLSLISISQVYLSRENTFICHNLGDVTREKYEELSFCY